MRFGVPSPPLPPPPDFAIARNFTMKRPDRVCFWPDPSSDRSRAARVTRHSAGCETRPRHPANSLALLGRFAGSTFSGTPPSPADSASGLESLGHHALASSTFPAVSTTTISEEGTSRFWRSLLANRPQIALREQRTAERGRGRSRRSRGIDQLTSSTDPATRRPLECGPIDSSDIPGSSMRHRGLRDRPSS
jgi:hypothetical protein